MSGDNKRSKCQDEGTESSTGGIYQGRLRERNISEKSSRTVDSPNKVRTPKRGKISQLLHDSVTKASSSPDIRKFLKISPARKSLSTSNLSQIQVEDTNELLSSECYVSAESVFSSSGDVEFEKDNRNKGLAARCLFNNERISTAAQIDESVNSADGNDIITPTGLNYQLSIEQTNNNRGLDALRLDGAQTVKRNTTLQTNSIWDSDQETDNEVVFKQTGIVTKTITPERSTTVTNTNMSTEQLDLENMTSRFNLELENDTKQITELEDKLRKMSNGSVEYMLMEININMKKESVRTRQSVKQIVDTSAQLQKEVKVIQEAQTALNTKVDGLAITNTTEFKKLQGTAKKVFMVSDQIKLVQGVLQKHDDVMAEIDSRDEKAEAFKNRNNLFITGIDETEDETAENVKEIVTDFFSQTMKITTPIPLISAERRGGGNPKAILAKLADVNDKATVYKHAKNLKGVKNNHDLGYFVNDHLPPRLQEIQRHQKDIVRINKSRTDGTKLTMKYKKGQLLINGEKFSKKVKTPTNKEVILPDYPDRIAAVKLTEGDVIANGQCRFIGMSSEVKSLEDVRDAYVKAKQSHINARHIVCSFRIPGEEYYNLQSYEDDNDHAIGRFLLKIMGENEIVHRAIFVARYYGGHHWGPSRFKSYGDAAKSAVLRSSFNSITRKNQLIKDIPNMPEAGGRNPSISIRGRGGMRRQVPSYAAALSPRLFPGVTNPHNWSDPWDKPVSRTSSLSSLDAGATGNG